MTSELRRYMLSVARQVCPAEAEDIVQEASLIAEKHPSDATSKSWLYVVTRRLALSHVRKQARRGAAILPLEVSHPSMEQVLLSLEPFVLLDKAIPQLTPKLQEAVKMRLAGRIADRVNIHRATKQLKEILCK